MYENFGTGVTTGVDCVVIEWVEWVGHFVKINENKFLKCLREILITSNGIRSRPLVKWVCGVGIGEKAGRQGIECVENATAVKTGDPFTVVFLLSDVLVRV